MSLHNDKNETSRFLGEGMSFKAKLIGILEVSEARGDRMCQEALSDLKIAIRAAGEHKQRIIINVAIDGLRLRDEKTGDSLYHHPVHKISFIAQDMTDSRAFGYIFGSPDTGHRFFGIKTDKAASQVVIAMRDLFQVVFALKKKEIELAKQSLEKNYGFSRDTTNNSADNAALESKGNTSDNAKSSCDFKSRSLGSDNKSSTPAVANLVDLEIELTNLQEGISQIEKLTPSDPFSSNDPFGDSFISYTPKPILPPPPSGKERSSRVTENSVTKISTDLQNVSLKSEVEPSKPTKTIENNVEQEDPLNKEWFMPQFNKDSLTQVQSSGETDPSLKQDIMKQFDVFTDLDPLGTGKIKPYVHKRDFFQDLKKPKKVLNDLVNDRQAYSVNANSNTCVDSKDGFKAKNLELNADPFGDDPFIRNDPFSGKDQIFGKDNFDVDFAVLEKEQKSCDNVGSIKFSNLVEDSLVPPHSSNASLSNHVKFPAEFGQEDYKKFPSEDSCAPKPPPRPTNTIISQPPPLPPKKQPGDLCMKPPPRPPYSDEIHYDVITKEVFKENAVDDKGPPLPAPARKIKPISLSTETSQKFKKISVESSEDDYLTPIPYPNSKDFSFLEKKDEEKGFTSLKDLDSQGSKKSNILKNCKNMSLTDLNVMLSQLTLNGLNELATELNIPSSDLSNMTLAQITSYLCKIIKNEAEKENSQQEIVVESSKTDFADFSAFNNDQSHDKYAVFRELEATEIETVKEENKETHFTEKKIDENEKVPFFAQDNVQDRYAALREITEKEFEQDFEEGQNDSNILFEESFDDYASQKIDGASESDQQGSTFEEPQYHKVTISQSLSDEKTDSFKKPDLKDEVFEEEKLQASDTASEEASVTSPEIEVSTTEVAKEVNIPGKNWAVFDEMKPPVGEKLSLQSEEGVSPSSSDSKEFGNGSPTEWKLAPDSGSEHWDKPISFKDQEKWWDTCAEPEGYRKSTDSFEDECCNYSRPVPVSKKKQLFGASPGSQAAGGHSSSSRDISPWEEDAYSPTQKKNIRGEENWERHSRRHFDKCRDSWDEEDDYEYDEQYGRYFWPERREGGRPIDRVEGGYNRNRIWNKDHWAKERYLWKQEVDRKRRCCENWDSRKSNRYCSNGKRSADGMFSHKWSSNYEDPHCLRDSQDSSWEDIRHQNSQEVQSAHFLNAKHRSKRPSSASEVEKNSEEVRNKQIQYYLGATGGSDGEKERRYKTNRRSRSRDAYYCESSNHHSTESNFPKRNYHHRIRGHPSYYPPIPPSSFNPDDFTRKATLTRSKIREDAKNKGFPPSGDGSWDNSYRTTTSQFENNFVEENDSNFDPQQIPEGKKTYQMRKPMMVSIKSKSQQTPPIGNLKSKVFKYPSTEQKMSRGTQRSPFEDDFSPSPKTPSTNPMEPSEIELKNEEEDYFNSEIIDKKNIAVKKIISSKFGNLNVEEGLKKSESVNIFAREKDPFDDEFFSGNGIEFSSDYVNTPKNGR